ncbi:MAG: TolC family protein [Verrucomicrobium sp.]|nr:TolC family protein [Verrucomicrobium sp.]
MGLFIRAAAFGFLFALLGGAAASAETLKEMGRRTDQEAIAWSGTFNEPHLAAFVRESLARNDEPALLVANVTAAATHSQRAVSLLLPILRQTSGGARTSYLAASGNPLAGTEAPALGIFFAVGWEKEMWKTFSERRDFPDADYGAFRWSLAAQSLKAWTLAVEARMEQKLAERAVDASKQILQTVQAQLEGRAALRGDFDRATADLAESRQNAADADLAARAAVRGLETLLGRYPEDLLEKVRFFQASPPALPAGLPSSLLERRPDVRQAGEALVAAFPDQVGSARLPLLPLTSVTGGPSETLDRLFDEGNPFSFSGSLLDALRKGGYSDAEFDKLDGRQQEAVTRYDAAARAAFREVQRMLDNEISLRAREESLLRIVTNDETVRKVAEKRYQNGSIDLTDLRAAEMQEIQTGAALIAVHASRLSNRADLTLALGGAVPR